MSHFFDPEGQIAEAEENAQAYLDNHEPDGSAAYAFAGVTRLLIKELRDTVGMVQRVREVHEPIDSLMYYGRSQPKVVKVCSGCGTDDGNWQRWPCPTIRAIERKP